METFSVSGQEASGGIDVDISDFAVSIFERKNGG